VENQIFTSKKRVEKERNNSFHSKINMVARVALSGGIIGALGTNPRTALESSIREFNEDGWNCIQIMPHYTRNAVIKFFRVLVLICTAFLWTFDAGYLLLLEKEYEN
jgi:hypothetical protein